MPTPIPRVLRSSHPGARSHDIDSGVIGSPACVLRRRRSDHGEGRRRWREGPQFRRSRLDVGGPQGQGRPRHQNLSLKAGRRFVQAYRGGCAPAVGCGGRASLFMRGITQPLSGLLAFRVRGIPDIWTLRCRAFPGLCFRRGPSRWRCEPARCNGSKLHVIDRDEAVMQNDGSSRTPSVGNGRRLPGKTGIGAQTKPSFFSCFFF